jgi:inhibitor of cysteine peptidase
LKSLPGVVSSLLAVMLIAGGACATGQQHLLGATDQGRTVGVALGDTLLLSLPETPATGYIWTLDRPDATPVKMLSSDVVRPAADRIGAPGVRTLHLKPTQAGMVQLRLKRWRPWEGDASVVERFDLTVQVTD